MMMSDWEKHLTIVAIVCFVVAFVFGYLLTGKNNEVAELKLEIAELQEESKQPVTDNNPAWITYSDNTGKLEVEYKEPVPEWFKKELNGTFGYGVVRIKFGICGDEEDIVMVSGNALKRLLNLADPDRLWDDYWDYGKCYNPDNTDK